MALLTVDRVRVEFGGIVALADLSFGIEAGQICALIGNLGECPVPGLLHAASSRGLPAVAYSNVLTTICAEERALNVGRAGHMPRCGQRVKRDERRRKRQNPSLPCR